MLGVRLGKHHQLNVSRVTLKGIEGVYQIFNFIFGERHAERCIGIGNSSSALAQHVNKGKLRRFGRIKQEVHFGRRNDFFGHAIMNQIIEFSNRVRFQPITNAALDPSNLVETTYSGDVSRL